MFMICRFQVSDITGLELTHVSATCSLYSDTDYLLVHDDLQEDRVVAYILYLTGNKEWERKYGGALQLFSKDEDGQPLQVVKDVWPSNNQFVFFPVSNDSYHQVKYSVQDITCLFVPTSVFKGSRGDLQR